MEELHWASEVDVPSSWRHIQKDLKPPSLPKAHQRGAEAPRTRGRINTWDVWFLLTFTEPIPACTVYVYSYKYRCVFNKELFIITCVASLWPVCHSVPLHFSLRPSGRDLLLVSPAPWSSPLLWRNHMSSSHCAECLETHLEVI